MGLKKQHRRMTQFYSQLRLKVAPFSEEVMPRPEVQSQQSIHLSLSIP
jgi:hypothetical protein